MGEVSPELKGLRCVLSALDPPRSIPNRVVQRRSAEGTGGMTPWETRSMHLEQISGQGSVDSGQHEGNSVRITGP